jgi:hypothetical protein
MSDPFQTTLKATRGTGTDDRDTVKVQVSAQSIDQLADRVEQVRERMEDWADDLREIQPDEGRDHPEDQSTLGATA